MAVLCQQTNTQTTFRECSFRNNCWDTRVEKYAFNTLKALQVKRSIPRSITKGLTNGSEARYAFPIVHSSESPSSSSLTICWISMGSLEDPEWFLIPYCASTMGIAKAKASPRQLDCLLFIYKACVREDVVSVKCITYCRTDGRCDRGDRIFVDTPSAATLGLT